MQILELLERATVRILVDGIERASSSIKALADGSILIEVAHPVDEPPHPEIGDEVEVFDNDPSTRGLHGVYLGYDESKAPHVHRVKLWKGLKPTHWKNAKVRGNS